VINRRWSALVFITLDTPPIDDLAASSSIAAGVPPLEQMLLDETALRLTKGQLLR